MPNNGIGFDMKNFIRHKNKEYFFGMETKLPEKGNVINIFYAFSI